MGVQRVPIWGRSIKDSEGMIVPLLSVHFGSEKKLISMLIKESEIAASEWMDSSVKVKAKQNSKIKK